MPSFSLDRKSTRLNSSHLVISYAVFCLKKKTTTVNRVLPVGVTYAYLPETLTSNMPDKLLSAVWFFFFFNDAATTEFYTLSLHVALPISYSFSLLFLGRKRSAQQQIDKLHGSILPQACVQRWRQTGTQSELIGWERATAMDRWRA